MLAIGGFLVALAVLTLAAVAPVFRRDNPPRWTTRGWIGELVTLAIVCTLAIGIGYLGAGAIEVFTVGVDYLDLGLLAVVLLVSVVIWRQWKAHVRPQALEAVASAHAFASGPGQARGDRPVATVEAAPVSASEATPPPKAA